MILRLLLSSLATALIVACGAWDSSTTVEYPAQVSDALQSCALAQISMNNPIWDPTTALPTDNTINRVDYIDYPRARVALLYVYPKNIYPGAPISTCSVDTETGDILAASYSLGEAEPTEIVFRERRELQGWSDSELDEIYSEATKRSFDLDELLVGTVAAK